MTNELTSPRFIDEKMRVIVPLGDGTTRGIWGEITCAAGYYGRVRTRLFERWFHIDVMRVPAKSLET